MKFTLKSLEGDKMTMTLEPIPGLEDQVMVKAIHMEPKEATLHPNLVRGEKEWDPNHIPVEHEGHPAYQIILKALHEWDISGSPPGMPSQFSQDTNVVDWLKRRDFDVPSVIDNVVEALIEEGYLYRGEKGGNCDL